MKTWFIALLLILATVPRSFARGGDEAGNGGGIAENSFVFAYLSLDDSIGLCLDNQDCPLTSVERELLLRIRDDLPKEYTNPKQLSFRSERQEPGFFLIGGQMKIARTGNQVGGNIYINIDLLYPRTESGDPEPLTLESATSILVHELGHHQGVSDHTTLDILGSKVGKILAGRIGRVNIGPRRKNFQATLIDYGTEVSFSRLLVSDGIRQIDLSDEIRGTLLCSDGSEPRGGTLYNPHWKTASLEPELTLNADVALFCGSPGSYPQEGQRLFVQLPTYTDDAGHLRLRPDSPRPIRLIKCLANLNACSIQ